MPSNQQTTKDLTKYQGLERGIGVFDCNCGNSWLSISAWANTAQKCRNCLKWTFPSVIFKPDKKKGKRESRKTGREAQHDTHGCQMCLKLSVNCIKINSKLSRDVYESQRRNGKKLALEQNARLPRNKPDSSAPNNGQNQKRENQTGISRVTY